MRDACRTVTAAVIAAAALAAGTAACGSPVPGSAYGMGTATPAVTPDPLAGLTADQITRQTMADLNNASSVRYAGTILESGQHLSVNLTLVRGHGCQGSVGLSGRGSVQMVDNGKFVWMLPNDSFYKSLGVSAAEIPLLSGKWLKVSEKSVLGDLSSACTISNLAGYMSSHDAGMIKGAVTSLDGQRAMIITQTGEPGKVYVSDTARPELLRLSVPKGPGTGTGTITFSDYGLPVTITPPPASKTLNSGELGPKIGPLTV
ncbi:MAG TPA: hypothetical protein VF482_18150 [Trebonia sp.]